MTTDTLTISDLNISCQDIYVEMGYGENMPDPSVCRETETMLGEISSWLKPRYAFFAIRGHVNTETNEVILLPAEGEEVVFKCGRIVARQLSKADAFILFICTAGTDYQDFLTRMEQEDMVKGYHAHAIGSVIAEKCADVMEQVLQGQIDKLNWKRTNRFSPGYCGWHVSEQKQLFPLFNGETAGVHLTDSAFMMPVKSVSGIIGIGSDVRYHAYSCGLCDYKDCYKRKTK